MNKAFKENVKKLREETGASYSDCVKALEQTLKPPKLSIAIPVHNMKNRDFFFKRLMDSIESQTFKDYEVVVTEDGLMAENTNSAIQKCKGDIIKILYMDDYLAHPNALQNIAMNFQGGWLAEGCLHDDGQRLFNPHFPSWHEDIAKGINTIGSPSVVAFENKDPLLFDENLSWLLDCELYGRLYKRYGLPTMLDDIGVVIGIGDHQMTHLLTAEEKQKEHEYINQ
uniref:Putative glycosyltransferase n=1 Tax=viral metagenome TaxID=1070528 RepID=A0A6M3J6D4_9ZZZZ